MNPTLRQILPVVVSIIIIIAVAILRNYSRTLSAVFATMPVNLPLSLWIFYNGADGNNQPAMVTFAQSLVIGIFPTVGFTIAAWLAFRAGWSLIAALLSGYLAYGVFLGTIILIRGGLG